MAIPTWSADGVTLGCVYWSETSNQWSVDGVALEGVSLELDGTSTITCRTFHLSPFAIADETSEAVERSSIPLLGDTNAFLEVRCPNLQGAISWRSAKLSVQLAVLHSCLTPLCPLLVVSHTQPRESKHAS